MEPSSKEMRKRIKVGSRFKPWGDCARRARVAKLDAFGNLGGRGSASHAQPATLIQPKASTVASITPVASQPSAQVGADGCGCP